jgi:hypothetical protein
MKLATARPQVKSKKSRGGAAKMSTIRRSTTEGDFKAAIESQDTDMVKKILKDRGFKSDWLKADSADSPLHKACLNGQTDLVGYGFFFSFFVFFFFSFVFFSSFPKTSILTLICRMLLEKGAPLDGRDDQGYTP